MREVVWNMGHPLIKLLYDIHFPMPPLKVEQINEFSLEIVWEVKVLGLPPIFCKEGGSKQFESHTQQPGNGQFRIQGPKY